MRVGVRVKPRVSMREGAREFGKISLRCANGKMAFQWSLSDAMFRSRCLPTGHSGE